MVLSGVALLTDSGSLKMIWESKPTGALKLKNNKVKERAPGIKFNLTQETNSFKVGKIQG